MGSYVPSTPAQRQEMLEAIGLHDFRQLYRDVPEEMLLRDGLDLPGHERAGGQPHHDRYGRPEHRLLRRSPGRRSL